MARLWWVLLSIIGGLSFLTAIACMPNAGEISNATDAELNRTCSALSSVGYDYWQLDLIAIGGRLVEVAADIHTAHSGPEETRKYCEGR